MARHARVLVANRGEIAVRVVHAAAALGMESVAVYAPVDAAGLHTKVATRAEPLPSTADGVAAYLDIDALVAVARATGCDVVHPGYGFLAEHPGFAAACVDAGLAFVGPPAPVVALFGDKVRARAVARSLGVPTVPGSDGPVPDATAAAEVAASVGFPVVLKASAGGGGRGIRVVRSADEVPEAFERCTSEAAAAFGDGSVFVERLVEHPRHVEVQILADAHGTVLHLHERDCSVQLRHQKVVEVAPAPSLPPAVRDGLLGHAVQVARAVGYVGAGTVEFLVDPATDESFFIECNPRIQVEHTVTEQITGLDLVEAQFLVAAGASLASIGLPDQAAVGAPRGFAVQARVVATGPGTLVGYREPSGAGVRVDACGYPGLTPPPQFDPLLAKVIGSSGLAGTYTSALDRTRRALASFHVAGLPTNLRRLRAILAHPVVQAGDARTTFLDVHGADLDALEAAQAAEPEPLGFLAATAPEPPVTRNPSSAPASFAVPDGATAVTSPLQATVVAVRVAEGDHVAAGQALVVLSAMKMETVVTAPWAGRVVALAPVAAGQLVEPDQVLVALLGGDGTGDGDVTVTSGAAPAAEDTWHPMLDDVASMQRIALRRLAPGSDDPGVVRQRSRGKLTCRERIEVLLDPGSFREVGSLAGFTSYDDEGRVAAFTPANHVGGTGTVDRRPVVVCADDFTSRGGHSDGAIASKSMHLDRLSVELRIPSIRLLDGSSGGGSVATMVPEQRGRAESAAKESSGAITAGRPRVSGGGGSFLPGHLGSTEYARQLATVPVANVLLGSVVGLGAAKAVLGHFSVMVRDIAQLFVAGPPVVAHAMGYDITKEELGDWRIHCRNGSVDNLAESEDDALAQTRRFLSYLPPNVYELPPVLAADPADPADRRDDELFTLVPRKRTTTFDVRRAIELVADRGSFFELGRLWGTDQVVGFIRMDGHPMGVIASDSRHVNGGALTADGCRKLTRHLDLCDLFHLPVLNLVDNPGFAVGREHEVASTIRAGGTWMVAFAQARVPVFTVLLRRSFGVAGNNYATPRLGAHVRVAWPAADVGGIPPEGGIEAAYKRQLAEAEDPAALRAEIDARIEAARGPIGPLNRFQLEEMIDPRDTRPLVCEWIRTAYRFASHPDQLGPRPLAFRP